MTDELSTNQRKALLHALDGRDSSYTMRVSISTCEALERRGLLKSDRTRPGCFYSPQTVIKWSLTPKGRDLATSLNSAA